MKNKKKYICICITIILVIIFKIHLQNTNNDNVEISSAKVTHKNVASKLLPKKKCQRKILKSKNVLKESEIVKKEFLSKLNSITSSDQKEWFISYKLLLEEYKRYPNYIDIPKSVYEIYEFNDIKIFQKLIAAETTGGSFNAKCNVASVVWNRVNSPDYPNNIVDVIYQRNGSIQFSPIYDGRIDTVEVTEDDVLAVEYTFMFGSTAYDCIAFDNVRGNTWNKNNLQEVFTDNINHTFYRK